MSETVLDLVTRVHLEGLKTGMADAISTVNSSVTTMQAAFAKVQASEQALGNSVTAQAAAFRSQGLSANEAASALKNLGFSAEESKAAVAHVGEAAVAAGEGFRTMGSAALEGTAQIQAALAELDTKSAASLGTLRGRLVLGENGFRVMAGGASTNMALMAAAVAASVGVGIVKSLVAAEIELDNLSKATGIPVDKLAELGKAVEASGAKSDDMTASLKKLDELITKAGEGSKTAALELKSLGVSVDQWNGIIPNALTVLRQMSDFLHENAGNAQIMTAAQRAFGDNSPAFVAFLSQGSQAVQKQTDAFREYGAAARGAVNAAKELNQQEVRFKAEVEARELPLLKDLNFALEETRKNWVLIAGAMKLLEGQPALLPTMGETAELARNAAGDVDFMTEALKRLSAAPKPPAFFDQKETKTPKGPSPIAEWKEEIAQRIEAEALGDEEAKQLEIQFWNSKLATQKAGSAVYLAVEREISRVKRQLANEAYRDMVANDRDIASLAESGSADRVRLEQKTLADISATHAAGTREYEDQLKRVTEAQQQADEQRVRSEISAVDRQVAAAKTGSSERVNLIASEIAKLQGDRQAALATAETLEKTAQVRSTEAAREADLFRSESFRAYAEFVKKQIEEFQLKFIDAQKAMVEASQKLKTESIDQNVTQRITTVEEGKGGIKDTDAEFQLEKQHITELAQLDLVSKSQAVAMLRQIQTAQHNADSEKLQSLREYISLQMQSLAATGGDITKLEEQYARVLKQIAEEKRKFDTEMAQDDAKTWLQMEQNAQRASSIISNSFTQAFSKMLTTHTTFANVMTEFWNSMVQGFAKMGLEIVANWIKHLAMMVLQTLLTTTVINKLLALMGQSTGTASPAAKTAAQNVAQVTSYAGVAGAAAFASVMEALPFPANVATAPEAMAGAIAAVMATLPLAAAAGGAGSIPHDMFVLAHANEMILPPPMASGLRDVMSLASRSMGSVNSGMVVLHAGPSFASGSGGAGVASRFGGSGGAGGSSGGSRVTHNNIEYHSHGSPGIQKEELADLVTLAIRRGELG